MSYIPQYVGIGDAGGLDYPIKTLTSVKVSSAGTGTGFVSGDVGATVTFVGGSVYSTPATARITAVSGGKITGVSLIDGGGYQQPLSGPLLPTALPTTVVTGGSGTGASFPFTASNLPTLTKLGTAGFGPLTQMTVSLWMFGDCGTLTINGYTPDTYYLNENLFQFSVDCGLVFIALYGVTPTTLTYLFDADYITQPTMGGGGNYAAMYHVLWSIDIPSQTSLFYFNDEAVSGVWEGNSTVFWRADGVIANNSDTIWQIDSNNSAAATGMSNLCMTDTFIDLTVEANRRQFINADLTPVDPSTLSAPVNLYMTEGDAPSAFANHGTGGAWTWLGTMRVAQGICAKFLQSGDHNYHTPYMTPITESLQGSFTTPFPADKATTIKDVTYRPGGSLTFALATSPTHGTVDFQTDGTFTYTPNAFFWGNDTFQYSVTEHMPAGYQQPGYSNTQTVSIYADQPTLSPWTITSNVTTPVEGGIGDLYMDQSYIDFSDLTTRRMFINGDESWVYLGEYADVITPGVYPLVWNTVQAGNTPDDFLYGYGQHGRAQGWSEESTGNDPTTGQPYLAISFDTCITAPALTMADLTCTAQHTTPAVSLRWSDDRGETYGNAVTQTLGDIGEFATNLSWRRLGFGRDRVFALEWSAPGQVVLLGASILVKSSDS